MQVTPILIPCLQIASALMHMHSKSILHRDLKTQNIFIARGNIIQIGDLGKLFAGALLLSSYVSYYVHCKLF